MDFSLFQAINAGGSLATMAIAFMFWRLEKRLTILEVKHAMATGVIKDAT